MIKWGRLPNDKLGYRDRISTIYAILSYLIYSGHSNVNLSTISRNIRNPQAYRFRNVMFDLVKCEVLDVIVNEDPNNNSRAFFRINEKGLELYRSIKRLKELTKKNNFLLLKDYYE